MKPLLKIVVLLFCISTSTLAQEEVKFKVEELSKPESLLKTTDYNDVFKRLISSDINMSPYRVKKENIDLPFNIIAQSKAPDSLVYLGYQSFFNGMYQAYADHRPFVISPDMIWLLISQGFARHLNANSELLRDDFVDFEGKLTLVVKSNDDLIHNCSASSWEKIFPEFTKQIAEHTGSNLMNLLSADFSTTTPVERVASQITIMEAMQPYFEFVVIRIVCGIPEITLKGTAEDWQKMYDKTKEIGTYDLKWWTNELEPILAEFIKTSKGEIDKVFWRNMFKYHSTKKYGSPKVIDGWIVKFFPYNKKGKRNNLKELEGSDNLPEEMVKVDLNYIEIFDGSEKTTALELWAGFIGLEQNPADFTLTPQIGWMIRKKDLEKNALKQKLEIDAKVGGWSGGINIKVKEIPQVIYELDHIKSLSVSFVDSIKVADQLKDVKIDELRLSGDIDDVELYRIAQMFPNTVLIINEKRIDSR